MTDWLTDERKSLILGAATFAFASAMGVLGALWLVSSVLIGSIRIISWIGGL